LGVYVLIAKVHVLARKGQRLELHIEFWLYKNEVAKELGDWIGTVFLRADSMYRNFYEGLATIEDVEDILKEVEKLVSAISKSIEK